MARATAKPKTKVSKRRKSARNPKSRKEQQGARNTSGLVPFAKGNPGKPKGAKNKFGVKLKEAILEAAERSGRDGKGKDGAVGYLVWLSRSEPAVFGRMLEKVMPLQIDVKDTTKAQYTPEEAVRALEERGLPIPQSLADLAVNVAVHNHEAERDADEGSDEEFNDLAPDTPEVYAEDDGPVDDEGRDDQDEEAA
jgi:hypothetical protein